MVTLTLILFCILAFLFDLIIAKRHIGNKKTKTAYLIGSTLFNIVILGYLVYSFFTREVYSDSTMVLASWMILLFMISFTVKGIFSFFSIIELILRRVSGKKFKAIIYAGSVVALSVLGIMIYGATIGRSSIRVERVVIESDDLPQSFDGFTMAQFSDAHLGNLGVANPLIKNLVAKINELDPDIVIQSGDLVNIHSGELNEIFMAQLSQIKAPVYSVLGNHDLAYYIRGNSIDPEKSILDLMAKQKSLGWTLLRNENTVIRRGLDSIFMAGVVYPVDNRIGVRNNGYGGSDLLRAFEGIGDSDFSILISHTPALFDSIPRTVKPNLTISGHVHAMQAKIKVGKWQWSPAKWLFPMWSGLYVDRGHYLYINDGLGYALYPMRIGTRPEITLYELKTRKNN